jgi:hypothetical protein
MLESKLKWEWFKFFVIFFGAKKLAFASLFSPTTV